MRQLRSVPVPSLLIALCLATGACAAPAPPPAPAPAPEPVATAAVDTVVWAEEEGEAEDLDDFTLSDEDAEELARTFVQAMMMGMLLEEFEVEEELLEAHGYDPRSQAIDCTTDGEIVCTARHPTSSPELCRAVVAATILNATLQAVDELDAAGIDLEEADATPIRSVTVTCAAHRAHFQLLENSAVLRQVRLDDGSVVFERTIEG